MKHFLLWAIILWLWMLSISILSVWALAYSEKSGSSPSIVFMSMLLNMVCVAILVLMKRKFSGD